MKHQWGRSSDAGRPPRRVPISTLILVPLALAAGIGGAAYYQTHFYTTLQRWYFLSYLKSTYVPRVGARLASIPRVAPYVTHGDYQLVDQVDEQYVAHGPKRYAHADMEPWLREEIYDGTPAGQLMFELGAIVVCVALVGLVLGIVLDVRGLRRIREGEILRGGARPRSVAEFNRTHRQNDGMRIRVER